MFMFSSSAITGQRQPSYQTSAPTLFELFSQFQFRIPHYQRNYAWKAEDVEYVLADITNLIDLEVMNSPKAGRTHMMQTVILHSNPAGGGHDIVDGQQRVTTLMLLVAALVREINAFLNQKTVSETEQKFAQKLLMRMEEIIFPMGDTSKMPRIFHSLSTERAAFVDLCNPTVPLNDIKDSKPMVKAVETVIKTLQVHQKTVSDIQPKRGAPLHPVYVAKIFDTAMHALQVNLNITNEATDAARSFQDINAKGKGLTPMELIRNSFAQQIPEEVFIPIWEQLAKILPMDKETDCTTFIRQWITAAFDTSCPKSRVYPTFQHLANQGRVSLDADGLRAMVAMAERWVNHTEGRTGKTSVDGLFWAETIGHSQHRPVLMAAAYLEDRLPTLFSTLSDEIAKTALTLSVTQTSTNTLENAWKAWARDIKSVKDADGLEAFLDKTLRAARQEHANALVTSAIGLSDSTKWSGNRPGKNRAQHVSLAYLAFEIEKAMGKGQGGAAQFYKDHTLEHILPVNPGAFRPQNVTVNAYRDAVCALGNLTFLTNRENSSASNKAIADKIDIYMMSTCGLTRASTQDIPVAKKARGGAQLLRILPKVSADFGIDDIQPRSEALAQMIAEHLLASAS